VNTVQPTRRICYVIAGGNQNRGHHVVLYCGRTAIAEGGCTVGRTLCCSRRGEGYAPLFYLTDTDPSTGIPPSPGSCRRSLYRSWAPARNSNSGECYASVLSRPASSGGLPPIAPCPTSPYWSVPSPQPILVPARPSRLLGWLSDQQVVGALILHVLSTPLPGSPPATDLHRDLAFRRAVCSPFGACLSVSCWLDDGMTIQNWK